MSPPPTVSPVTGNPVPPHYVHSSSLHFQDVHGRSLLLRGVNLSGGAKAPQGQPSWQPDGFWEEAEAGRGDFVGRPLNLEDGSADVHLARLRAWGYNFLRFVFTWEALEHEGPGKYDLEYIEYVVKVLYKCKEWGFRLFMDPHQDVWSRFTGGSGAPLWTIYACGIDPMNITSTYAALLHHEYPSREIRQPQEFPQMIWATNYTRLASQTIWTLFFAGKAFAPKCIIDGVNIQDYLQNHFIDAVGALAKRIAQESELLDSVVIGWDSINEPGDGLIGHDKLDIVPHDQRLKKGPSPSPFDGMRLGMGEAVDVDDYTFTQLGPRYLGKTRLDARGTKLWLAPEDEATRGGGKWGWTRGGDWKLGTCIWAQHGVWDPTTSKLLRPDYFRYSPTDPSRPVDHVCDFWRVHWMSYASCIRLHHPEAIHFIQPPTFVVPPALPESFLKNRICTSPHYYDGLTLMTKHWNWFNADALGMLRHKYWGTLPSIRIGETAIRKSVQDQLGVLKQDTSDVYGNFPTLIGEIGCPFDMDDRKAYGYVDGGKGEGDYSSQQRAWDCSLNAADGANCLNYTLWTYVPDNSHRWGDQWNMEDLSIWSQDDATKAETFVDDGKAAPGTTTTVTPASGVSHDVQPRLAASTSSATLGAPSLPRFTPRNIESGDGVTSALILEGSRAVAAACRPYPIATVGIPARIDFDIASTSFKLSVRVRPDDHVSDDIVTEVYLPYVHYASSLAPYTWMFFTEADSSKTSLLTKQTKDSVSPSPIDGSDTPPSPLKLNVDVNVTHGSYSISGQTLCWTYPVPSTGDVVYSLEVKRVGGAMRRELGYVQQGGWGEVCPSCTIA